MTTLVITLAWAGLLPGETMSRLFLTVPLMAVPLAALILGRDAALTISAFYFRYISLPPPVRTGSSPCILTDRPAHGREILQPVHTLCRSQAHANKQGRLRTCRVVRADGQINTALQLVLMGVTTVSPLITYPIGVPLEYLQWVVAGTTIWSGLSYVAGAGVRILPRKGKKL